MLGFLKRKPWVLLFQNRDSNPTWPKDHVWFASCHSEGGAFLGGNLQRFATGIHAFFVGVVAWGCFTTTNHASNPPLHDVYDRSKKMVWITRKGFWVVLWHGRSISWKCFQRRSDVALKNNFGKVQESSIPHLRTLPM